MSHLRLASAALPVLLGLVSGRALAFSDAPASLFLNELHYDNDSTDSGETIELAGPAGTRLDGYTLVLYNGNDGAPYDTRALSGTLPDQAGGYGTVAVTYPSNGIQNGAPDGIALVDASGHVVQFLSYEGSFAASSGPALGLTSTDIGVAEGSTAAVGTSLALSGVGTTYQQLRWAASAAATFGQVNAGQRFGVPDGGEDPGGEDPGGEDPSGEPCTENDVRIGSVQGEGDTSIAGTATIEGVVVGDYEGPSPALRGFYVQDQGDGNPLTSDGIFVFNGNADSVALGDVVQVTGAVSEYQGQTQLTVARIEKCESGRSIAPAQLALPVVSSTFLERYEGMLVTFPQTLSVTEHFQLGRFGEIVVSSGGRLVQPTAVAAPGAPAQAIQAQNDLNRLIIDDATNAQNPDPISFGRGGQPLSAANTLRGGDTLTGATGVLTYTWAGNSASGNAYRLRVVGDLSDTGLVPGGVVPSFVAANAREDGTPEVGDGLRIASFNVLNYFLTLDAGSNRCGPEGNRQECRGAETADELTRQREKLLSALASLDADVLGLIELENSPGVEPLADLTAGLNARLGVGTYSYVDTGVIGTDAIRVGLLYRPAAVALRGSFALLNSAVDPRFIDTRNRPALAQSFSERASGEVLTVVVNHLKSKGCDGAEGLEADQGDGQGCWNPTRTAAAQAEVDWLRTNPTGVAEPDVLLLGDLNAYAQEDPVQTFVRAGFVDLPASYRERPYSYVFSGQWGYLDHALATQSLAAQVVDAVDVHINADEPSVLDYNTNFKTPAQIASLFAGDRFRTSDHDPVLVGIELARPAQPTPVRLAVTPSWLWPSNHKLQTITVIASIEGRRVGVKVREVRSSEADAGLGRFDVPGDVQIRDRGRVALRAESYARAGRTYTLTVEVTRPDGKTENASLEVEVPHDRLRSLLEDGR